MLASIDKDRVARASHSDFERFSGRDAACRHSRLKPVTLPVPFRASPTGFRGRDALIVMSGAFRKNGTDGWPADAGVADRITIRTECGDNSLSSPTRSKPQILLEALRGQAEFALAKLRAATMSRNPSIKGASREEVIREFMRCFLPTSYAIGHGEVFSADNERSKQVDVIIHDDAFSPVFRTDDGGVLVPCEAVYGSAEVKTRLDRNGWEQALDNVASVKRLERTQSDLMDILPNARLQFSTHFATTGPDRPGNPYLGIVVCLEGLSAETLANDLNDRKNRGDGALLPDLVACVGNGHLIARYNRWDCEAVRIGKATLGGAYDGFRAFRAGDFVLSSLHLGLNVLLSGIRLKNRDLASDWLDELLWIERKSQIEALFAAAEQAGVLPAEAAWDAMEAEARERGEHDIASKLRDLRRRGTSEHDGEKGNRDGGGSLAER